MTWNSDHHCIKQTSTALNGTKVADKVSTQSMLEKFQLLSVNQLAAEIKLTETWKSINIEGCPIKLEPYKINSTGNGYKLRPQINRIFKDDARLQISQSSINIDAAKVWNKAPEEVKKALTLAEAKRKIKSFCKLLPI